MYKIVNHIQHKAVIKEQTMFTVQSLHVAMEIWGAIFCALAAFCIFYNTGMKSHMRRILMDMELASAVLMSMDAMAWGFRGYPGEAGYIMVRISNFMVFLISDIILLLVHTYVCMNIYENNDESGNTQFSAQTDKNKTGFNYFAQSGLPKRVKMVYICGMIGILLVIITQFTGFYYYFDENNFYHRSRYHFICLLIGLIAMFIDASLLIQNRKKIKRQIFISIMSYLVLPILASAIQLFIYGVSLINISITISMMCMFVVAIVEQGKELTNARVDVMLSQIQPHFIYNTLTSIKYLCRHDPQEAVDTINEFSLYLRGNINSLTECDTISFGKELDHVRHYVAIEQKRFGDRMHVEYDIHETDFKLPPLTLQPLVENAVKHGICKRDEGGTVVVSTGKEPGGYRITIKDDGIGFDVNRFRAVDRDGTKHVGLINVKKRIEQRCGGTLEVRSVVGEGTTISIYIPD